MSVLNNTSLSFPSTGFTLDNGAGTNWMVGDSSYRIGIGTTNPREKLEVVGNIVADGSDIRSLSGTHLVSYASASDISNSALSISGISSYVQVGIFTGTNTVATSANGKTIIVGTPEASGSTGGVYVFDRVGVGNSFNQVGSLTGSLATSTFDYFGQSVATSADGKTIVVGAHGDELTGTNGYGLVYVFDRVGNSFNQVGILTGSLAVDLIDSFGWSVTISADGETIVVGAPSDEFTGSGANSGVTYVFDRVGNSFNQVGILTGSLAIDGNDNFGWSVATNADGKTIVVGAYSENRAYVFDRVGNSFNQVGILVGSLSSGLDNFGNSVGISADGKTIVVGSWYDEPGATADTGVVYVFDRVGNSFNQVGILTGSLAVDTNDQFGNSVAISADGKTIVVGANADEASGSGASSGVAYVFKRQGNLFNQVGILTGSLAADLNDSFGKSVATSADGKSIVVTASGENRTYVFDETRSTYLYSGTTGNIGIGISNPSSQLHITGQFQSTQANSTLTGGGQIYLNGATGNRIDFNTSGVAAPAFTTRSVGTKLVLYPNIGAFSVDYAFGIESSTLWSSIPDSTTQFKWYAGTTNIATLSGTGNLTIGGGVSGATATPTNINLGVNYSNGATRDKLKIYLYNSGTEQYGFSIGASGDVQYHSNAFHDFYIGNVIAARINGSRNLLIGSGTDTGTSSQTLQVTGGAYVSSSVGLGITNPTSRLHLYEPSTGPTLTFERGTTALVSGDALGTIDFVSNDSSTNASGSRVRLIGESTSTLAAGQLRIQTKAGSSSTFVDRVKVGTSSVTVGTTANIIASTYASVYSTNLNSYSGYQLLINTDTQVDISLALALFSQDNATNYLKCTVVGLYNSGSSTYARVVKTWEMHVTYTSSTNTYAINGSLLGFTYNSDATNFAAGASVTTGKILPVISGNDIVLRLINRTSPAAASTTLYEYRVEHLGSAV